MAGMYPHIRSVVRGLYDTQKLRIAAGQRVVAHFRHLLGLESSEPEKELDNKGQKILAQLRSDYSKMTDGVIIQLTKAKWQKAVKQLEDPLITEYTLYRMVEHHEMMISAEALQIGTLKLSLRGIPVYEQFLKLAPGIGPAMAGIILSEIDIRVSKYASNIFSYAGLAVMADGCGQSRRAEHMKDVDYIDGKGVKKTRKSLGYNPWLKTKLVGVGGGSMLKAIKKEFFLNGSQIDRAEYKRLSPEQQEIVVIKNVENRYSQVYRDMIHRYQNRVDIKADRLQEDKKKWKYSDLRIHNMATRYMVKRFLADLYENWRALEGLPVHNPYEEDKLGMVHTGKKAIAA